MLRTALTSATETPSMAERISDFPRICPVPACDNKFVNRPADVANCSATVAFKIALATSTSPCDTEPVFNAFTAPSTACLTTEYFRLFLNEK